MTPPAPRPGAAAVVTDRAGRVLLHLCRVGGPWTLPGRTLGPGESARTAAAREVAALCLDVPTLRLVGVYATLRPGRPPEGDAVYGVTSVFEGRARAGRSGRGGRGGTWGWFPVGALPEPTGPCVEGWVADALLGRPTL